MACLEVARRKPLLSKENMAQLRFANLLLNKPQEFMNNVEAELHVW